MPDATVAAVPRDRCRACGSADVHPFLDLGSTPLADALLRDEDLGAPEPTYPLVVGFCAACTLVQLQHDVPPRTLFVDNYLYFSSYSDALLAHARSHVEGLVAARGLGAGSLAVEVASNDGYLLRWFRDHGVRVVGVDPAPEQAAAARAAGIPTVEAFFDRALAERLRGEHGPADVVVANNVLAHVPDPGELVAGIAALLGAGGVATIENPSVLELVTRRAFDTIYHEHFSYLSCTSVDRLLRAHGLRLLHVEPFPELHGGTLRWHAGAEGSPSPEARAALRDEAARGADRFAWYEGFGDAVRALLSELRALLAEVRSAGATVAAYGAAAKGATLLNVAGLGRDDLDFVVDRNPHKQGRYLPGSRLPVLPPEALLEQRPDYVLLLAWNFADEVLAQQAAYRAAGGRFIVPVPRPEIR